MTENEIGEAILGAAMRVHPALGPGLLGYLLNFNVAHRRDGIARIVNGL
jgi:hypothetical protein